MSPVVPPGAGGPRRLPDGFEDRLVGELEDAQLITRLRAADAARPLTADLAARLEGTITGQTTRLPARFRRRLERSMVGRRPVPAFLQVAAVVLFALGLTALPFVIEDQSIGDGDTPSQVEADGRGDEGGDALAGGTVGEADASSGGSDGEPPLPLDQGTVPAEGAGDDQLPEDQPPGFLAPVPAEGEAGSGGSEIGYEQGPAPPFAFPGAPDAAESAPLGAPGDTGGEPPPPRSPLRVGLVGGDPAVVDGFRAYVDLLNDQGGVRQREIKIAKTSAESPAQGTVATVNGSGDVIADEDGAPDWVEGPLFEAPDLRETLLHGAVFSFTSVWERQAHLAALAAFPEPSGGDTAVIYRRGTEPFGDRVPDAYREALEDREVSVLEMEYDPEVPVFTPTDAAFLALDAQDAARFFADARAVGYAPDRGFWGVGALFDEARLEDFSEDLHLASPYSVGDEAELDAVRERSDRPVDVDVLHGWITAKSLAVAIWESDAETPRQVRRAIRNLEGYENGFMPPYEVREGTNSRTPEAIVLGVADGQFVEEGGFETDPY